MPRAFLITHRRYNGMEEFEEPVRDYSPERGVRIAEYNGCGQPTSDGVSDCGSETSSECPEELYNLTKLAEVSLAAAAGTLIHPGNVLYQQRPLSPRCAVEKYELPRSSPRQQQQHQRQTTEEDQDLLREKTRRFFERVETERDTIIDRRSSSTDLEVSPEDSLSTLNDVPRSSRIIEASTAKRPAPLQADITKPAEDPEVHECPDCGKKYSTSSNLARHRQTHRSLGDKKARRCPHCDKVYVSMPAYSMHVRTHNQGCKCHYCGKCFSRPWLLQGHIRTHTGEKPFKCTICSKAFADKSNLRAHIQTHSNTKPHVCGRCGKAFALKSYLYKHEESSCMRAHHRTSSESKSEKRETDLPILIGAGSKIVTNRVVASPTSVIVPRLGHGASAREPSLPSSSPSPSFPTIRHTAADDSPTKRQCRVRPTEKSSESVTTTTTMTTTTTTTTTTTKDSTSYLSQMVIRTSVISPNPEHLGRFAVANGKKSAGPFNFEDPTRSSAFSRPTGMTLNLAIA